MNLSFGPQKTATAEASRRWRLVRACPITGEAANIRVLTFHTSVVAVATTGGINCPLIGKCRRGLRHSMPNSDSQDLESWLGIVEQARSWR